MRTGIRKSLKLIGIILLVALVSACAAIAIYSWHIRSRASSLLSDVSALRIGTSKTQDAERLAAKYRSYLDYRDCKERSCSYTFVVANSWLWRLHLAPGAQFRSVITVEDGVITRSGAGLLRANSAFPTFPSTAGIVEEYVELSPEATGHYGFATPVGKPYLRVRIDQKATLEQRQRAYAFSFRCLTQLGGGCDLPCDYLPQAWLDWKAMLRNNSFPMDDFDRAYPENSRCERWATQ